MIQTVGPRTIEIQNTAKSVHDEAVRIVSAQIEEMSTQMAALDQFVTRARSQNDLHHKSQTTSLVTLGTSVCDSYSNISNHFTAHSDRLSTFGTEISARTTALQDSLSPLDSTIRAPLVGLRKDIEAAPLTEYTITGETPQKANYSFPTSLPRTQPREKLLSKLKRSYDVVNGDRSGSVSPSKRSPSKALVYNDNANDDARGHPPPSPTRPSSAISDHALPPRPATALGLREVDANVLAANDGSTTATGIGMGPPSLKRHATTTAVESALGSKLPKLGSSLGSGAVRPGGRENLQGVGLGGNRRVK
jgi:kinesin family member 11